MRQTGVSFKDANLQGVELLGQFRDATRFSRPGKTESRTAMGGGFCFSRVPMFCATLLRRILGEGHAKVVWLFWDCRFSKTTLTSQTCVELSSGSKHSHQPIKFGLRVDQSELQLSSTVE